MDRSLRLGPSLLDHVPAFLPGGLLPVNRKRASFHYPYQHTPPFHSSPPLPNSPLSESDLLPSLGTHPEKTVPRRPSGAEHEQLPPAVRSDRPMKPTDPTSLLLCGYALERFALLSRIGNLIPTLVPPSNPPGDRNALGKVADFAPSIAQTRPFASGIFASRQWLPRRRSTIDPPAHE